MSLLEQITPTELNDLVQQVVAALQQQSTGVSEYPVVTSLNNVLSMPAYRGEGNDQQVVTVPVELLKGDQVELRNTGTEWQWKNKEDASWKLLITVADLQKPAAEAALSVSQQMTQISDNWNNNVKPAVETATTNANNATTAANTAAANVKDGKTPQFAIGTVARTGPGENPTVMFTADGTDASGNPKYNLNLTLPTGDTGPVPVIETGTITTEAAGSTATATLVPNGTTPAGVQKYLLNMSIPKGDPGKDGTGVGNVFISNLAALEAGKLYLYTPVNATQGTFEEYTEPDVSGQVNAGISAHNTDNNTHQDIRDHVDEVEAIARGKSRARVFDTVAQLDTWLAVPANVAQLQVGDNFYIRATDIPDYWWDGSAKQPLESEKVDLSGYTKVDGSNVTGTWPISITGNAATAEVANTSNRTKCETNVVTLNPSDWAQVGGLWKATISDTKIDLDCLIEACPDVATQDIADASGIYAQVTGDVATNSFTLTAKSQPTAAININYSITYVWQQ